MRTYGQLSLGRGGRFWYLDQTEPHVNIKLKSIFPKIGKNMVAPFEFENTLENCAELYWFMQRYAMQISNKDLQILKRGNKGFYQNQTEMEKILCPEYTPPKYDLLKPDQDLRWYQTQPVELLHRTGVLLCGDDIGLGKTYVGIGGALNSCRLPAAFVVQSHLPKQWKEMIEEFCQLKVHVIKKTTSYKLPPADIYIFRYTCLSGWQDVFETGFFKYACFDEAQELRNGTGSAKGVGAACLCRNVGWVMALTATPVYNYADEIWKLLDILKKNCLGSYDDFIREWGGTNSSNGRPKIEIKDPKALGTYLREKYLFLRRTRSEVGKELKPINRIVQTVGYDEAAVKSAEDLARKLAIRATTGSFIQRGQAARELDMMLRQATGVSKARHVAEFVKIMLENGEPVVLVGWHRAVYDIWLQELAEFNPAMYTGSESPKQKTEAVDAFLSGKTNLLILSLRSGVGLNHLQERCSTVVFGELDWSPKVHDQVVGRVDREGQENQVMVIFLVSDSGSDPLIVELLGIKASQARGIVDPHLGLQQVYSDESRLQLLVKRYLKGRGVEIEQLSLLESNTIERGK